MHKLLGNWEEELKSRRRSANRESKRTSQHDNVKALNKLIKECEKRAVAENERNKNAAPRTRTEDSLQEKHPFDELKHDSRSCPFCKHDMLMRIEWPEEIQAENNWIKAKHEQKIKEWNRKPRDSRPTKPRMKKTVCQTLACYCMMQTNGKGCVTCRSFCNQGLHE
jgi:hypothetical protein